MIEKEMKIWVAGASSGLAEATLAWLVEKGASLVLHGSRPETMTALKERWSGNNIAYYEGDITSQHFAKEFYEAGDSLPGRAFGFLCFVGIPGRLTPDQWSPEAFSQIFSVNAAGPLLACRYWAEQMKTLGLQGNAVLFSTMQAQYPFEGSMTYALGKVALEHGVQLLAKEFAPTLKINGLAPGVCEAGMAMASIAKGKYHPYIEDGVISRFGQPEDIRGTIAFLLAPELYMTGQTLLLDGGFTLRRDQR